ncbi:MAG TPA: DNA primase DnaG, partial [archaeon]|nr:DNA primase DnaG [archaeon]
MAKLAPTYIKYVIKAKIQAKGLVEKPDVIGAVFGQTEGLLGADLDLRELQRSGRIGRVEVELETVEGNSEGEITIPSALDAAETALIAATLETIERIGPCLAEIKLEGVEDVRFTKRQTVVDKAKEILKTMQESGAPRLEEVSEQIRESVRVDEITNYEGLPAGPGLLEGDEIIVVEGRADVLLLLRYGIRNTVAVEGTSMPQAVVELTKQKTTTVFVDGDRGGELIIRELLVRANVDFIAQAPPGKEVEDLSRKEAGMALRDRVPP